MPPQQVDWEEIRSEMMKSAKADETPGEQETFTMTRSEAENFRELLMADRKFNRDNIEKDIFEESYTLCEH